MQEVRQHPTGVSVERVPRSRPGVRESGAGSAASGANSSRPGSDRLAASQGLVSTASGEAGISGQDVPVSRVLSGRALTSRVVRNSSTLPVQLLQRSSEGPILEEVKSDRTLKELDSESDGPTYEQCMNCDAVWVPQFQKCVKCGRIESITIKIGEHDQVFEPLKVGETVWYGNREVEILAVGVKGAGDEGIGVCHV